MMTLVPHYHVMYYTIYSVIGSLHEHNCLMNQFQSDAVYPYVVYAFN